MQTTIKYIKTTLKTHQPTNLTDFAIFRHASLKISAEVHDFLPRPSVVLHPVLKPERSNRSCTAEGSCFSVASSTLAGACEMPLQDWIRLIRR